MKQTYYKVVRIDVKGNKVSCLASKELGLQEIYMTSKGIAKIVPNGMVFVDSYYAHRFAEGMQRSTPQESFEVWECIIGGHGICPNFLINIDCFSNIDAETIKKLKRYYRNVMSEKINYRSDEDLKYFISHYIHWGFPSGTHIAKDIKLVKPCGDKKCGF